MHINSNDDDNNNNNKTNNNIADSMPDERENSSNAKIYICR